MHNTDHPANDMASIPYTASKIPYSDIPSKEPQKNPKGRALTRQMACLKRRKLGKK